MVKCLLRAEALPQGGHADLRRERDRQPERHHRGRAARILASRPRAPAAASAAPSPRRSSRPSPPRACRYVLGSVLNQVLLHQSVIGLGELRPRWRCSASIPTSIIGCAGGGSNLGGLIAPFMQDKLTGRADPRIRRGRARLLPLPHPRALRLRLLRHRPDHARSPSMYTLGSGFIPSANHAGGLRYHGMSPILSKLYHDGYMEAVSVEQTKVFEAAVFFATHGDHPARPRERARHPRRPSTRRCAARRRARKRPSSSASPAPATST